MRLIESLEDFLPQKEPIALTIGVFDGCHLGHRAIFDHLFKYPAQKVALTFDNHPSTVLRPDNPTSLIYSKEQKLKQLDAFDTIISIPFTQDLANLSCKTFLEKLHERCRFSYLVLGHDAAFGKNKGGDRDTVKKMGEKLGFEALYLPAVVIDDTIVSSTAIRKHITSGNLRRASHLLGRPYSISGPVIHGRGQGKAMGFPTANLALQGLCFPPFGVYKVEVIYQGKSYKGVTNLGLAPTVSNNHEPLLETLLIDFEDDLYGQQIKVTLNEYIRPEKAFSSVGKLKEQIDRDLIAAKT